MSADLFEDLEWRGQIHQETNAAGLRAHCAAAPRRVYSGFDPTAPSLTVGNLVPLLLLRRFQLAGHTPVVLLGGGTGLIGDPSGKEAERQIQSRDEVEARVATLRPIFERVLAFDGPYAAMVVNNADWLTKLGFIEVLRDVGKHFSVNMMIQKDSVRERLQNREQGISFTEFSYMLLQAYDFQYLFEQHEVTIQIAGSDQWGNIVAGVELTRRVHQAELFGLTAPLVTKADGGKFGKTEAGAIWLTADRMSPYAFYQFWLNTADADLARYLKTFTLLSREAIEATLREHEQDPSARLGQRALATFVTELLHGAEARADAEAAARALFSGDVASLSSAALEEVFASAPSSQHALTELEGEGKPFVDLLVATGLARSKREAREFLSSGAVRVNGDLARVDGRLGKSALLHGSVALIRRGRKTWHLTRWR